MEVQISKACADIMSGEWNTQNKSLAKSVIEVEIRNLQNEYDVTVMPENKHEVKKKLEEIQQYYNNNFK